MEAGGGFRGKTCARLIFRKALSPRQDLENLYARVQAPQIFLKAGDPVDAESVMSERRSSVMPGLNAVTVVTRLLTYADSAGQSHLAGMQKQRHYALAMG